MTTRKPRAPKKPRFTVPKPERYVIFRRLGPTTIEALVEIDRYIREGDCRGDGLRQAASDVLDGWATKEDLQTFFRQKLMVIVDLGPFYEFPPECDKMCGQRWTVDLTDRAMRIFWPDRMEDRHAKG